LKIKCSVWWCFEVLLTLYQANGRIPAILDRTTTADGKAQEKRVFEGMAIMLYLCQKYDRDEQISSPFDTPRCVSPLFSLIVLLLAYYSLVLNLEL